MNNIKPQITETETEQMSGVRLIAAEIHERHSRAAKGHRLAIQYHISKIEGCRACGLALLVLTRPEPMSHFFRRNKILSWFSSTYILRSTT